MGPEGVGRMSDTSVGLPGQAAWALGGGAEGAATAVVPYIIDQETLPLGSHGQNESSEPMNWATRAGYGFIPGAAAGLFGARVPMGGGAVADLARAEGALTAIKSRARDLKAAPEPGTVLVDALEKARKRSRAAQP
jgi:hypothetical protein